jgi:NTP pyrophosphatase (non-canonical NTP hydrolase)
VALRSLVTPLCDLKPLRILEQEGSSVGQRSHNYAMTYSKPERDLAVLPGPRDPTRLTAVLCGSFRKDRETLRADHGRFLSLGCAVLSPPDLEFVEEVDGFVLAEQERDREPSEIEADHLRAMEEADFVWLHSPEGYLGRSAAMELGFAHALGLRVFARTAPVEVGFAGLIEVVASPDLAVEVIETAAGEAPSRSIVALQRYYQRMAELRGWDRETAEETLDLLTEEIRELAEALGKRANAGSQSPSDTEDAALELADVQLYVVHLANVLGLDLGTAVMAKERINQQRFRDRRRAA